MHSQPYSDEVDAEHAMGLISNLEEELWSHNPTLPRPGAIGTGMEVTNASLQTSKRLTH
jgi:hypothetical protein